jgi:hypothetical protein
MSNKDKEPSLLIYFKDEGGDRLIGHLPSGKICLCDRKSNLKPKAGEWYLGCIKEELDNVAFADLTAAAEWRYEIFPSENRVTKGIRRGGLEVYEEDYAKHGSDKVVESVLEWEDCRIEFRNRRPRLAAVAALTYDGRTERTPRFFRDPAELPDTLRRERPDLYERLKMVAEEASLFARFTRANAKFLLRRSDRRAYQILKEMDEDDLPVSWGDSPRGEMVECEGKTFFLPRGGGWKGKARALAGRGGRGVSLRRVAETALDRMRIVRWIRRYEGRDLPTVKELSQCVLPDKTFASIERAREDFAGVRRAEVSVEGGGVRAGLALEKIAVKIPPSSSSGTRYERRWTVVEVRLEGDLNWRDYIKEAVESYYASVLPLLAKRGQTPSTALSEREDLLGFYPGDLPPDPTLSVNGGGAGEGSTSGRPAEADSAARETLQAPL